MTRRELGVCIVCLYGRGEPSVYGQLHLSGWVPARAAQSLDDIIQNTKYKIQNTKYKINLAVVLKLIFVIFIYEKVRRKKIRLFYGQAVADLSLVWPKI